jgi:DNA replication protein DnaC
MDAIKGLLIGPQGCTNEITTEIKTCDIHGEYESKSIQMISGIAPSRCPSCILDEKSKSDESDRIQIWDKRARDISMNFVESSLPPRFQHKTIAEYKPVSDGSRKALSTCEKYANNFQGRLESGGGLIMCGQAGTGKTHLAAGIINKIKAERFTSAFMSVLSATRHVKATYSKDNRLTEAEAISHFIGPDLLVLDEVGVQFGSEAEKIILFEIINQRYQHVKPTILISNLTLKELSEYIGERVVDRMYEGGGAVLSFDWDSYRRSGQ